MKILSLGNFEGLGWDGSITDENHIADALEELGHGVKRLQRGSTIPLTNGEGPPLYNLILVAQFDGYDVEWLYEAKKYFMCPLVFWAFDFQEWGQQWCEDLISISDLYLSKRIADSKYPNWQWLSQDFSPHFLRIGKGINEPKDIEVLFTGSYLDWATERNETLRVVNEKFNLVIHSVNAWPEEFHDVRPPIMDEGLPELYARAGVILSIDHTLEAGYWSDRNAQIMCCGRRPLFRYVPLSEVRFSDRVNYFFNIDDCLTQISQMLQGASFDSASYNFAQDSLKIRNRVQDLLTIVKSIL